MVIVTPGRAVVHWNQARRETGGKCLTRRRSGVSTQITEKPGAPDLESLLAAFEPVGWDAPDTGGLFLGPVRLVVQAPDIRNDYKKCAGSSDGAKTYDTTAT
jgi:hypothetical protein